MTGHGKLTGLLSATSIDPRKIVEYGRSKKLDVDLLFKLAIGFTHVKLNDDFGDQVPLLHLACCKSKPNIVKILLKEGWSVNGAPDTLDSPLWMALDSGNIPVAHLLMQEGADTKYTNKDGLPLIAAALSSSKREKSCVRAIKLLMDMGVFSVNDVVDSNFGAKPIHLAAYSNHTTVISFLIQNGADFNAQNASGCTALHISVANMYLECMKLLVRHGADLYIENAEGEAALHVAVRLNLKQAVEALIKEGYDVNRESIEGTSTALHVAICMHQLDLVKLLIALGADPNKVLSSSIDSSPFHALACRNLLLSWSEDKETSQARKDIAEFLFESGGNLNNPEKGIITPLHTAIKSGFLGLAKLYVRLGANVNTKNNFKNTLFHQVVTLNRDIIELFLEYGADYNAYDHMKITPYNIAILQMVDLKFIKCFIKYGCPYNQNPAVFNKIDKSLNWGAEHFFSAEKIFFKGIQENDLKLVKVAVTEGAVVSGCSEEIKYPLHFLAFHGYNELLSFLLNENVSPNTINERGESALYIAAKLSHYDCCCTLLRFGACYNYFSKARPKKT